MQKPPFVVEVRRTVTSLTTTLLVGWVETSGELDRAVEKRWIARFDGVGRRPFANVDDWRKSACRRRNLRAARDDTRAHVSLIVNSDNDTSALPATMASRCSSARERSSRAAPHPAKPDVAGDCGMTQAASACSYARLCDYESARGRTHESCLALLFRRWFAWNRRVALTPCDVSCIHE